MPLPHPERHRLALYVLVAFWAVMAVCVWQPVVVLALAAAAIFVAMSAMVYLMVRDW